MDKAEMDTIRVRCDATTPGVWVYDGTSFIMCGNMMVAQIRGWGYLTGQGGGRGLTPDVASKIMDVNAVFIAHAHKDIPALLDALEKMITSRGYYQEMFEACRKKGADIEKDRNEWRLLADAFQDNGNRMADNLEEMTASLERWKARAEALERAIFEIDANHSEYTPACCQICKDLATGGCGLCVSCENDNFGDWTFDEARFTPEKEADND